MIYPIIYSTLILSALTSCSDDDNDNKYVPQTSPSIAEPVIAEHVIAAPIRVEPITAEDVKAEEGRCRTNSEESVSEKKNLSGVDDATQSYFAPNYSTYSSANYWDSDEEE